MDGKTIGIWLQRTTLPYKSAWNNKEYSELNIKFAASKTVTRLDPPVYTANEVKEKIGAYRDHVSRAETEIHRLQNIMEQKGTSRQSREEALHILETLRDTNLENASFEEQCDLIAKLGIKVYPSEDGKVIRISSTLQFTPSPLVVPPYKISVASPKL